MIKDLKLYKALTCHKRDLIVPVAKKLRADNARHIYVLDDQEKPMGVISAADIVNKVIAEEKDPKMLTAEQIMNSPVDHVDSAQEVEFAMKIMMQRKTYSCLVTEKGKVKGIVDYKSVMDKIIHKVGGSK